MHKVPRVRRRNKVLIGIIGYLVAVPMLLFGEIEPDAEAEFRTKYEQCVASWRTAPSDAYDSLSGPPTEMCQQAAYSHVVEVNGKEDADAEQARFRP